MTDLTFYLASTGFAVLVWAAIIVLNEKSQLLSCDHFPNTAVKWFAYLWLGTFLAGIAILVTSSARTTVTAVQLQDMPFYSLFAMHAILMVFLLGWWLATARPPLREFLNIRHEKPAEVVAIGVSFGVGGWVITILTALLVALILQGIGVLDNPPDPPAMIGWMADLAWWKKILIILSAMTVEEFFFRSFLQKRIGLVASTVLFSLAHFTYGNPLMLIGVTVVSIVIGIAFYRTKNVLPGILAHGVFDAIQLFVIVPVAVRMTGMG